VLFLHRRVWFVQRKRYSQGLRYASITTSAFPYLILFCGFHFVFCLLTNDLACCNNRCGTVIVHRRVASCTLGRSQTEDQAIRSGGNRSRGMHHNVVSKRLLLLGILWGIQGENEVWTTTTTTNTKADSSSLFLLCT
jgi:hypothetical protein